MGKSIGTGSLSIWTHQLKDIKIIDNYADKSTKYTGSAVTFGAGWQTADIYNALDAVKKVIVAGECAVSYYCNLPSTQYMLTRSRAWGSLAATSRAEAMAHCPPSTAWLSIACFSSPS